MLPQSVHTNFNVRIIEFEKYLCCMDFSRQWRPRPALPPTELSHSTSAPLVPRPGPSQKALRTNVAPVPSRPALAHLADVAPGPAFTRRRFTMLPSTALALATHFALRRPLRGPIIRSPDLCFTVRRPTQRPIPTTPCMIHPQTAATPRLTSPQARNLLDCWGSRSR